TMVSKVITVNAAPTVAAIIGVASVCIGSNVTYTSATAGGVWSSSAPGIASVNSGGLVSGVSAGSAEIRYTVSSGSCSTMVSKVITVNAAPTVAAIIGVASVCIGSNVTYTSATAGGVWSSSAPGIASVNSGGLVNGVSAGSAEIRYTVTSGGCSTMVTKLITVNAVPNVTVTSPSVCAGQTAQPVASGATSYTWTGGLSAIFNPTTPALTTTTTYTVTGTTAGCSKTAVATVTVNTTAPTVTITPNPASVCIGDAITLSGNGANNYTWTTSQTGTTQGASLTFTPIGTTTVNLSGTLTGCSTPGTTSVSVTIKGRPTVGVTLPSVCVGQTAQPIANGAVTYTWTGGLASISNPVTPPLTITTTYTVTGTASNGCSGTAISTVTVKPTPGTPTITQSHDTLFSNVNISGASYEWYKGGVLQTTTSTSYYKFPSSGTYTVKVINNSCPSAISANFNAVLTGVKNNKLNVELSIIPNPNNGSFEIRVTSGMNKTYQLKLFNLSGQVLVDEEMNIRTGQNSKQINLTGIEKGVYFLSIIGEDGTTTQNIIVQ
ncbi:MAG: T9SS type A sorting domain-containing protein, partial [Chitinophagales bacterium]|nr:T9SS type A sorting domain-containing protein [Chitinophagales bacterium]